MSEKLDFQDIMDKYSKRLFNAIYGMIGDYEDTSDVTQDTLIIAYKSLAKFRGESNVYTWLFSIARNECRRYYRKRKVANLLSLRQEIKITTPEQDDPETDIEAHLDVRKKVVSLPIYYREVVVLKYFEGLSYEDIAKTLNISIGTVRSRLSRGREILEKGMRG